MTDTAADTTVDLEALAEKLDEAQVQASPVPMLSRERPLTTEQGYGVQKALIARRVERGERVVGAKLGLTSRAKMDQVGVHEPIRGVLTDGMHVPDEGTIRHAKYCHPRVEPEIAFVMGDGLEGRPASKADALAAVVRVHVALEVIDSRYENFKFTLADVVADNCSSAAFVLGDGVRAVDAPPLDHLGVVLRHNGQIAHTASTAAVLGNPLEALGELATMLGRRANRIEPGWIVLSGGATAAIHVQPGDVVEVDVEQIGSARLVVEA